MIDTLRFKIPVDPSTYKQIEASGIPTMSKKSREGYIQESLSDQIYLPTLEGGIRLYVLSKNVDWNIFLEFSAPKVYYGHNLFLLYPDALPEILLKIMDGLNQKYGVSLSDFSEWILQRIDLCTVWKLPSDEVALSFLHSLKDFEYPRKKVQIYDTSLTYRGSSSSVKFYLKHPEFMEHDYSDRHMLRPKYADNLAEYSKGCLRFEAEYRKSKLNSTYGLKKGEVLHIDDILNEDLLRGFLIKELQTWLKNIDLKIMTDGQNYHQLCEAHGIKKAIELFQFYIAYAHDQNTKTILKKAMDKSTINRKLQSLAKAGVGLRGTLDLPFELNVPSTLNPNQNNQDIPDLSTSEPLPEKQLNLPLRLPPIE